MLFSMLSFVGGVATRLPLLLPLAAMMMIWVPRLLGVQGKLGAAENERTAEARASRGAEEEGARAMVVAGLSSKLLLLLSATADSAMLHSLGIALEPNSPKEEEPKTPRPSRPNRHRKKIRRRINALHRRKVWRRRKLARRRRLRRRRELWGRAKLRCSGKPIGGSRRRQKRGIARRNADDAVILNFDKRSPVPKPKSFAHTKRGLFPGAKGPRKKPHEPLCKEKQSLFGLDNHTPLVGDWQDFLKNRQHRDGVFSVLCEYIRGKFESIRAK
ncbi:unnamed protein product, partial [Pylaiella littoralis]